MRNPDKIKYAAIHCLSVSSEKGQKKRNVKSVEVVDSGGIEGDIHADTDRPISLLPYESFAKMSLLDKKIKPGDFAENITTTGLDFNRIDTGSKIALGNKVILEVIQIGKECHNSCYIKQDIGDCIMPSEGVFARALHGGKLMIGDKIRIIE